jgi:hypothetical protein
MLHCPASRPSDKRSRPKVKFGKFHVPLRQLVVFYDFVSAYAPLRHFADMQNRNARIPEHSFAAKDRVVLLDPI